MLDKFKDRKVGLSVESQFDPTKIKKAAVVLKDLEAEHGSQFAEVKPTYEKIPATNAVKLVFNIEEGPKVKVGMITFQGNTAFSDRRILRSMRRFEALRDPGMVVRCAGNGENIRPVETGRRLGNWNPRPVSEQRIFQGYCEGSDP